MKIWITKWALTRGILEAEAELVNGYADIVSAGGPLDSVLRPGDFFTVEAEARNKAEKMAADKVAAAEKVIAKLRGKTGDKFKVGEFK